jgi:hypothetical protein
MLCHPSPSGFKGVNASKGALESAVSCEKVKVFLILRRFGTDTFAGDKDDLYKRVVGQTQTTRLYASVLYCFVRSGRYVKYTVSVVISSCV